MKIPPAETLAETLAKYSRNIPKETPKERWIYRCMFVSEVFPEVSSESKYSIGCLVVCLFYAWKMKNKKEWKYPLQRPWQNTLERFLKKPKKKDEMMVVCFVPLVYSKVFPEVSAESKYSIVCLVVFLFILCLVNEE